ncbi:MAG: hypothetical protein V7746_01595 [Halioglobus sp.]
MTIESLETHDASTLVRQALAHGSVALALAGLLFMVYSWALSANTAYVSGIAFTCAFLSGLGFSHIIHEWCHYVGARMANSAITLKPKIHPLFFDFDLEANTSRQFLWLSMGGLVGNFILLALLVYLPIVPSIAMTGLLAAVLGQIVFVLILELPVSVEVMRGKAPLAAITGHFEQGGPLFLRAALGGIGTAVLVFLTY